MALGRQHFKSGLWHPGAKNHGAGEREDKIGRPAEILFFLFLLSRTIPAAWPGLVKRQNKWQCQGIGLSITNHNHHPCLQQARKEEVSWHKYHPWQLLFQRILRRVASTCKHGLVVRKVTLFVKIFEQLLIFAFTLEEGCSFNIYSGGGVLF